MFSRCPEIQVRKNQNGTGEIVMPSIHIPEDTFKKYADRYGYEEAKIRIKQATEEWLEEQ